MVLQICLSFIYVAVGPLICLVYGQEVHDFYLLCGGWRREEREDPSLTSLCGETEVAVAGNILGRGSGGSLEKLSPSPHDRSTFILN